MKYVVTDDALDAAHEVYEKACGITAIDWALRAALESFAQTLGEPVAVPDAIGKPSVAAYMNNCDYFTQCGYADGWNACREAMLAHPTTEKGCE